MTQIDFSAAPVRWLLRVTGIVQGVGFRPFVYGLALRHGLAGFVRNDSNGVEIEIEGAAEAVHAFATALREQAPPLARIDSVTHQPLAPLGATSFQIAHSQGSTGRSTLIAPDTATCPDCLRELFDPADRRFRYPFINCTNCGPRFTIVADVPYDRAKTTMRVFPMCPACQQEYENPLDRRFHAQPNACPVCGPRLFWRGAAAESGGDPLAQAVAALLAGQIVAIKGLGGYHLACDAANTAAVRALRQRKHREAKPFALMVATSEAAQTFCQLDPSSAALLASHRRPIVLARRRANCPLPAELAPGQPTLGLMLPYTPLHALLLNDFTRQGGRALVMTSGNASDEPIAYRDEDAFNRLATIADGVLYHNREILTRCDDTVARIAAGGEQFLRRSRGYAPEPLRLEHALAQPVLAYGAQQKHTFCLARGHEAFLSHHIGDMENLETLASLREGVAHFQRLFAIEPTVVAYDLHPGYMATHEALAAPQATKIGVQHHHAHIASVLAEHGLAGPVIGVAADGTGYGLDGTIWGGEILIASLRDFERVGHLAYVPLPGGEAAVRQPWRVAAAYLRHTYGSAMHTLDLPFSRQLTNWPVLEKMIERGINSPLSSSMGRLFDAVAALIGLRGEALYEGQAAIELEAIAQSTSQHYPFALQPGQPFQIDVRPSIRAVVADLQAGTGQAQIAGRFHTTVARFLHAACQQARAERGLNMVALSGGVFQNVLLLETLHDLLVASEFQVYVNRRVPPNDGGLSLGQAAVAAARVDE